MTTRQLRSLAKNWQKILRIQDWQLQIQFVTPSGLSKLDGRVGECIAELCNHSAIINILRSKYDEHDEEWALVHELLHVVFAEQNPSDKVKEKLFERGIDTVSYALVGLKRAMMLAKKRRKR